MTPPDKSHHVTNNGIARLDDFREYKLPLSERSPNGDKGRNS